MISARNTGSGLSSTCVAGSAVSLIGAVAAPPRKILAKSRLTQPRTGSSATADPGLRCSGKSGASEGEMPATSATIVSTAGPAPASQRARSAAV